jgi:hypothetical protein
MFRWIGCNDHQRSRRVATTELRRDARLLTWSARINGVHDFGAGFRLLYGLPMAQCSHVYLRLAKPLGRLIQLFHQ